MTGKDCKLWCFYAVSAFYCYFVLKYAPVHAMKAYGEVVVQYNHFSVSPLDGEWPASRASLFTPITTE